MLSTRQLIRLLGLLPTAEILLTRTRVEQKKKKKGLFFNFFLQFLLKFLSRLTFCRKFLLLTLKRRPSKWSQHFRASRSDCE